MGDRGGLLRRESGVSHTGCCQMALVDLDDFMSVVAVGSGGPAQQPRPLGTGQPREGAEQTSK